MTAIISGVLIIIALLLWFIWRQLEQIAISLRQLYVEATKRYLRK